MQTPRNKLSDTGSKPKPKIVICWHEDDWRTHVTLFTLNTYCLLADFNQKGSQTAKMSSVGRAFENSADALYVLPSRIIIITYHGVHP